MRLWQISVSALILVLSLLFVSCSSYSQSNQAFVAGETLTPQKLDEISRQIFDTTTKDENTTEVEIQFSYDGVCFWVKGSEVFHISTDCRYIKKSKNVKSGDDYAAASDGCVRMCSACEKQSITTEEQTD